MVILRRWWGGRQVQSRGPTHESLCPLAVPDGERAIRRAARGRFLADNAGKWTDVSLEGYTRFLQGRMRRGVVQ